MVSNVIMIRKYRRNNRINKKGDKINVSVTCKLRLCFFLSLTDIYIYIYIVRTQIVTNLTVFGSHVKRPKQYHL